MPHYWTDRCSFVTGVVRFNDLGYFVIQDDAIDPDEFPHSYFVIWDMANWYEASRKNWSTVSITVCKQPIEQMIAIGPYGEVFLAGSNDMHEETIGQGLYSPVHCGPLRKVRFIGAHAYAVGMGRQVYRREGMQNWTCIDQQMRPLQGQVKGFEAIDGFSEEDIYAVGWDGEIWQYDGRTWRERSSPTNLILHDVCCTKDGEVYISGQAGLLLRGCGSKWECIATDNLKTDIWSLAWYFDKLYISTFRGLFVLKDDKLELVDLGNDFPSTFYHLSSNNGVLWSIGRKDVMSYDGNTWTRID